MIVCPAQFLFTVGNRHRSGRIPLKMITTSLLAICYDPVPIPPALAD